MYEQHNQSGAVRMWQSALKSTTQRDDRFQLLGYLYQGHMDWGKYRFVESVLAESFGQHNC